MISYVRLEFHEPEEPRQASLPVFLMDVPYLLVRGVVPPLHVLNEILQSGGRDGGMGPGARWTPFSLTNAEYAALVADFQRAWRDAMDTDDARFVPEALRIDPALADAPNFETWMMAVCSKYK